jgi:hypothetical protein
MHEEGGFKLAQPNNKEKPCQLYIFYYPAADKTLQDEFSLNCYDECKDGLAHGLGWEIEKSKDSHIE